MQLCRHMNGGCSLLTYPLLALCPLMRLMCLFPAAQLGNLSSRVRVVRMKNVLTKQEDTIEVPSEETVVEIRER